MSTVRVCPVGELGEGVARRCALGDAFVAAVRIGDAVYVVDDRCSHEDYSLAEGEVDAGELTIECPRHGSVFSLVSGAPESLPATAPVRSYVTRIEDGWVVVEVQE